MSDNIQDLVGDLYEFGLAPSKLKLMVYKGERGIPDLYDSTSIHVPINGIPPKGIPNFFQILVALEIQLKEMIELSSNSKPVELLDSQGKSYKKDLLRDLSRSESESMLHQLFVYSANYSDTPVESVDALDLNLEALRFFERSSYIILSTRIPKSNIEPRGIVITYGSKIILNHYVEYIYSLVDCYKRAEIKRKVRIEYGDEVHVPNR